jgi:uncharacterized metal-binding protein
MKTTESCACSAAPTLIFACSGAADVGEITDRAARQLTKAGQGRMYCLAGVGGRVLNILATVATARKILVIDGCATACGKQSLEQAGFTRFEHFTLAELGLNKGSSAATPENIQTVVSHAAQGLNA